MIGQQASHGGADTSWCRGSGRPNGNEGRGRGETGTFLWRGRRYEAERNALSVSKSGKSFDVHPSTHPGISAKGIAVTM
jgi:hypothetical protein